MENAVGHAFGRGRWPSSRAPQRARLSLAAVGQGAGDHGPPRRRRPSASRGDRRRHRSPHDPGRARLAHRPPPPARVMVDGVAECRPDRRVARRNGSRRHHGLPASVAGSSPSQQRMTGPDGRPDTAPCPGLTVRDGPGARGFGWRGGALPGGKHELGAPVAARRVLRSEQCARHDHPPGNRAAAQRESVSLGFGPSRHRVTHTDRPHARAAP
jgi:hypothetical protein